MKIVSYLKNNIFVYFLIGMALNSGLVLIKPLLLERLLNIHDQQLTFERVSAFIFYGFCLHLIFFSTMLLANLVSNNLQRYLQVSIKNDLLNTLFQKNALIDEEKVSLLTQDMELLYDRFFLPMDMIIGRVFILCTTIIFILWQNVLLGLFFVIFSFLRPLPQFLMNDRLVQSGAIFSQKQKAFHLSVSDFFRGLIPIIFLDPQKKNCPN